MEKIKRETYKVDDDGLLNFQKCAKEVDRKEEEAKIEDNLLAFSVDEGVGVVDFYYSMRRNQGYIQGQMSNNLWNL